MSRAQTWPLTAARAQLQKWEDGTTALAVLVRGSRLVVANVGDCRAVLCRAGAAISVSRTHSPASERSRIEAAGGWVTTDRDLYICRLRHMDLLDPFVRSHAQVCMRPLFAPPRAQHADVRCVSGRRGWRLVE